MPFRQMDQKDAAKTSSVFKEIHILSEGETDSQKHNNLADKHVISAKEDAQLQQLTDSGESYEGEPLTETKESEAHSIGNLLPDEDDLFSGIIDKLRCGTRLDGSEDEEDLFQSGGGMELEPENCLNYHHQNGTYTNGVLNGERHSNGSIARTPSYNEQFSRTLIVRNINSSIEDSDLRSLLEKFGDVHSLNTTCKHRGYVVVSYFDIRAAWGARNSLHNKPSGHMNLDIQYLIPKDDPLEKVIKAGTLVVYNLDALTPNDNIGHIFGSFGEIKEIGETLECNKFIEYYDIRAAEVAYRTLNWSTIAGKQIKLELGRDRQFLVPQLHPVLAQDERSHRGSFEDRSSLELAAFAGTLRPSLMSPSRLYGGSVGKLHPKSDMTIGAYNDNAFSQGNFSVPGSFPVRVATGDRFVLHEPRHPMDQENFSNSRPASHNLHSLPDYYNGSAHGISYNSFSSAADSSIDANPRILEGINDRNVYIMDPKGQQAEPHVGVFGSSWTSGCSIPEDYYIKRNSNSFQQFPTSPMGWTNSLPLANGTQKLPGLSRSSTNVLNTVSHSHDMMNKVSHTRLYHDGSLPVSNLSRWNNEHAYMESIGRLGLHNKVSDIAPRNYLHDENHIGKFINSTMSPPQRLSDFVPGVNLVASAPTSFGAPKERMRNQSNWRSEADSCHADKMKYELDIDRVLRGEDSRTTLMIKNIPNKYTSKMLLATIDEQHRGTYDFIYLPIDFKNKCNMGYAFINMTDSLQIVPFYKTFNGKKWEKFNSGKVASIAYARIQGKSALVAHFQNSSLMNEDKRCRPILFCTEGPNAGDQEPFPLGTSIRSRSSKPRSTFNDENHNQASPSSFVRGDVISSGASSLSSSVKDTF
ncbi:protein MEI2-like 4 isoform X1 [Daucus carota subsp. sativus]|uniref:protein MEI2-like 4 isoform X1 n=1 Tax=Daucus carota subsp. sativus TaxID=79200 RepID=UPI003083C823